MNASGTAPIPYQRHADPMSNRMSGAAALAMAYHSFGLPVSQAEIWPKVSRRDGRGDLIAQPYLLCNDALERGLVAVVFQARDPLAVLQRCLATSLRVILHHRLNMDLPEAHYTVLLDLREKHVVVHDPHFGPDIRVLQSDLLKLWQPRPGSTEGPNRILICLGTSPSVLTCTVCGKKEPPVMACPACAKPIALQPAIALGCADPTCEGRTWQRLYCPSCGIGWSGSAEELIVPPTPAEAPGIDPALVAADPERFAGKIEQLCEFLLTLPNGKGMADSLRTSLQNCKDAHAEEVERATRPAKEPEAPPPAPKEVPAAAPRPVEPPPPPDGNQLGTQMLRNLGFLPPLDAGKKPPLPSPAAKEPPKPGPRPAKKKPVKTIDVPKADDNFGTL